MITFQINEKVKRCQICLQIFYGRHIEGMKNNEILKKSRTKEKGYLETYIIV